MKWTVDDIITTDKYLSAFPNDYRKTDVFYLNRPFLWRGNVHSLPKNNASRIVAGHSDAPITEDIVRRYPYAKWFCVNKQTAAVQGIPLGITNNTNESSVHPIYGDVHMMVDVAKQPRDIHNLVYMNFSIETYPNERRMVWDIFERQPWVTSETPENSMEGRRRFLQNARNHSFVLCPRGNGVDTHRLWETLYMGSIPIVIHDIAHSDWTDLPILFVDSWDEVTEERVRKELVRIESTSWNTEKLLIGYWIERIKHSVT